MSVTPTNPTTDRFRPIYRPLSPDEQALLDQIKAKAAELEALIGKGVELEAGRYSALAQTALEQAVMWAVKAVTT